MIRLRISPADRLFSLYIRSRDLWRCQRCHRTYKPPTSALHCSHFHGRGKKSVRFDPDNAVAFCWGCHKYMESQPYEHNEFFYRRLGKQRYEALLVRANTPQRVDEKLIAIGLKAELTRLGVILPGTRKGLHGFGW